MKQQKKELNNIRVLFGCFLFGVSPPQGTLDWVRREQVVVENRPVQGANRTACEARYCEDLQHRTEHLAPQSAVS